MHGQINVSLCNFQGLRGMLSKSTRSFETCKNFARSSSERTLNLLESIVRPTVEYRALGIVKHPVTGGRSMSAIKFQGLTDDVIISRAGARNRMAGLRRR